MNKKIIILSTLVIAIYIIYRIIGTHLNWYVLGGLSAMLIWPIAISDKKEKVSLLVTLFFLLSVNVFYFVLKIFLKIFMNYDFYIWIGFVYSCLFLKTSHLRTLKYSKRYNCQFYGGTTHEKRDPFKTSKLSWFMLTLTSLGPSFWPIINLDMPITHTQKLFATF